MPPENMASGTPPNGFAEPKKPSNGRARVPVAIPKHYHSRGSSRVVTQTATPAKSEKSDVGSGDEQPLMINGTTFEHPMTPESLPSSTHKPLEGLPSEEIISSANINDAVSMPPLEPQATIRQEPTHHRTTSYADAARPHDINGSKETSTSSGKPRSNSKPLRLLQGPPQEFHPSQPSSTPMSATSSHMGHPYFYPQANGYNAYAPQMPPRPVSYNPEAHFKPHDHLQMSRTPSHASSTAGGRPMSGEFQSPVMPVPSSLMLDMRNTSALALQDHMLKQFDHASFSDLTIVFQGDTEKSIYVHSLIISRSEKLWKHISELKDRTIVVEATSHMTEIGFVAALKYMYGAPLLVPENLFFELGLGYGSPPAYIIAQILGYVAAGHYLVLPEVVQAGLNCARHMQTWDTIVPSLAFSLDGGLEAQAWSPEPDNQENSPKPTYGNASTQLLRDSLFWIAIAFPMGYHFVPTATQLQEAPRLPAIIESRPSQADPRLSLIQFGELAIDDDKPDYLTLFVSSILLSLPFATLQYFFSLPAFRSKPLDHVYIAEAVIAEREDRRIKVLQAKRTKEGKDSALWEATRYKEEVIREPYLQLRRVVAGPDDGLPGA